MVNTATVAIITRTKDRPKLLERALKSVHSQTFNDFIHVIINDGGNKGTVNDIVLQCKDIIGNHALTVIHNESSSGMEAASNKAIKSVGSTYVAIHDDDDTWHPEFLARTVSHLKETDAKGVVVRADKVIERLETDGSATFLKRTPWMPHLTVINLYRQCIDNHMTPITFVYKREVFDEIGYYDESLPVCGDWDFGLRFLQKWDVDFLDPGFALANYHHRKFAPGVQGNTSYAGNDKAKYWTNYLMNKYLRQELQEGRLGVGYIMSEFRYNESRMAEYARKILPSGLVSRLKKRLGN